MQLNKEVEQAYITSWWLVDDALTSGQRRLQILIPLLHRNVHTATLHCWLLPLLSLLLVPFLLRLLLLLLLLLSVLLPMRLAWL